MARKSVSFEEQLAGFLQTTTKEQAESVLRFAAGIVKARFPEAARTRKSKAAKPTPDQPRLMA